MWGEIISKPLTSTPKYFLHVDFIASLSPNRFLSKALCNQHRNEMRITAVIAEVCVHLLGIVLRISCVISDPISKQA